MINLQKLYYQIDQNYNKYMEYQNFESINFLEEIIGLYKSNEIAFEKDNKLNLQDQIYSIDILCSVAQAYLSLADFQENFKQQLELVSIAQDFYIQANNLIIQANNKYSQKTMPNKLIERSLLVSYYLDKIPFNRANIYVDMALLNNEDSLFYFKLAQEDYLLFQEALNMKYNTFEIRNQLEITDELLKDLSKYFLLIEKMLPKPTDDILANITGKRPLETDSESDSESDSEDEEIIIKLSKKRKLSNVIEDDTLYLSDNENLLFSVSKSQAKRSNNLLLGLMKDYSEIQNDKANQTASVNHTTQYYQLEKAAYLLLDFETQFKIEKQPYKPEKDISPCVALAAFFLYRAASMLYPENKIYQKLSFYHNKVINKFKQVISPEKFFEMKQNSNIFIYFRKNGFSYDFSEFKNKSENDSLKLGFEFLSEHLMRQTVENIKSFFIDEVHTILETLEQNHLKQLSIG